MWIAQLVYSPEDAAFGFGESAKEAVDVLIRAYPRAVGRKIDVAEVFSGQGFSSFDEMPCQTMLALAQSLAK